MLVHYRVGGWLPKDHRVVDKWLAKRIVKVDEHAKRVFEEPLSPVLEKFKKFIEDDPIVYMGFHQMFEQVPLKPPYCYDPTGKPQVRDYRVMLRLFDNVLKTAPEYEDNDFVGFPINAILDWPMGTPAGFAMFTRKDVNGHFKDMFDVWTQFLTSSDSCYVLNTTDNGWFGPAASEAIPNFVETYVCDPDKPHYGFTSWDDFFTRRFREGMRPVHLPGDEWITSACESTVYCRAFGVKERDHFWLKGQPYSLADMFNHDDMYTQFVGGTVYQAFLSATKYHRWHSPVNGIVQRVVMVPGTYYAESPAMGFDPVAQNASQTFITTTAARSLIYIQADNPAIGLMCFVAVGMAEVSTCEVGVKEGDAVRKGEEIGMFHFGGSTHCLVFRPETKITFPSDQKIGDDVLLNSVIAKISA
ncbi:phosphatidylserine decarboxylase-like protein [Lentinus tigrinus ALCF2SS1-7]|uniref:Phosphatidylserine decarboxylase-like protein n=1 Tax=Lentinus tigrinus ALCF2SS1-6 TaxID=1328759 RepID=A0A5C2S695_9APHY|nr:phosphatidylserine decarboxylase-like protein [Lentinus tigrinus ALCF2SS1-6]RPD73590.1 phosphatidylserine decarboxylase-like protein [Lentinus tigrinus ALCF2SS1-7]